MSGAVGVARADLPTDLPHALVRVHAARSRPDPPNKWDYTTPRSETEVGTTGSSVGRACAVSSARRGASTRSRRRARLKPSSRPSATAARAECGRAEVRSGGLTAADRAARDMRGYRAARDTRRYLRRACRQRARAQRAAGRRGWGGAMRRALVQPGRVRVLRVRIIAIRAQIIAIRVRIIAIRVPIIAIRVPIIAIRVRTIAIRVPIIMGRAGPLARAHSARPSPPWSAARSSRRYGGA
jgi:hypothetical protein